MVPDPSIVMVGKRGSGKSVVTKELLYHYRHIPGGVVIAPTDKMNNFYKCFFPDLYIHYEIKGNILQRILTRQKRMIEKQKQKREHGKRVDPSGILVMDDCLAHKKTWAKDEAILEILMNGRHFKLTFILTMQTPLGVTPELRLNFDYFFLLKDDSAINKKNLYENYASMFETLFVFEKVFAKCTSNHRCMVVDNRAPMDNIKDKVFWFKAKLNRNFYFGSNTFKQMHKTYYDPEPKFKDGLYNASGLFETKKKKADFLIDLK